MSLETLQSLIDEFPSRGDAPALIAHRRGGQSETWSYARLAETAGRFATGLRERGVGEDDLVALFAPNMPEWVAAFLGIVRAGAIAMPLNDQLTDQELANILEHSSCTRMVTSAKHLKTLAELDQAKGIELILLDEADADAEEVRTLKPTPFAAALAERAGDLPSLGRDKVAALLYTSGTTGMPKGVPLTHGNLCSNVDALLKEKLAVEGDRVLLPLPMHHAYPLTVGLLAPLRLGLAIVLPAGITGPQIMQALKDGGCTIMIAVPRLYEAMLTGIEGRVRGRARVLEGIFGGLLSLSLAVRRRFGKRIGKTLFAPLHRQVGPKLRMLASGGAKLDPEVAWKLEGLGWEVLTGYGLTETSPILTFNPPGRARLETAGMPVEGVELKIAPQEDTPEGQGEIQAKGPGVFAGYWQNPEATEGSFSDDGFFETGDLGFLDDDGYLHIAGRSKELIVLGGGKNIFPDEVEAVYAGSDLVREVAVLEQDNRLVGLFVPDADAIRSGGEDLQGRLRGEVERLSGKLPQYQRIGDFAITRQPLPRTQIGKLRRHELPEIFEREKSGEGRRDTAPAKTAEDRALIERGRGAEVWAWLQKRFEGQVLTLDTSPQLDLGLDSFDWMSLTMELQERFGVRLSEEAVSQITTLRDLLQQIEGAEPEAPEEGHELSPEQERWLEPPGTAMVVLGRILFGLNVVVMKGLFRLRAEGAERVAEHGRFLITPNHASFLDPFAIAAALSWSQLQNVYWAGWTGLLFRGPITRLFSRAAHVVPVDPERGITSTLAVARAVLERDRALVWFPEGSRSRSGELQDFLPGIGWLIEKTGARAIPVVIEGTHEAWPVGRKLPRPGRVRVRFGEPIAIEAPEGEGPERHAEIAGRLRDTLAGLGATPEGERRKAA
jgi:long-chain acyl-CoA synthetase